MPKICSACGQEIPQPLGRLICSQCQLPIKRGQGGWIHGSDGRPKHKDCSGAAPKQEHTASLLD